MEGLLSCVGSDTQQLTAMFEDSLLLQGVLEDLRAQTEVDCAHDLSHIARVLGNALEIRAAEGGDLEILIAAVLLHDIKNLPKGHPQAKSSSSLSAAHAGDLLQRLGMPADRRRVVQDAIVCHSFSRGLRPSTLEGLILQDADRLDAIGATGIARVFAVSGQWGRPFYHPNDPFARSDRVVDDKTWAIDHFFVKLLRLPSQMNTSTAREMATYRLEVMKQYLDVFERELYPQIEKLLRGQASATL